MTMTEQQQKNNEAHDATRQRLREAEQALHGAIAGIQSATYAEIHAAARCIEDLVRRKEYLANVAYSNRAEWSGGALNPSNIIETMKRQAAIEILQRPPFDIRGEGATA